ncbi:FAD binding domain-containing protein, partial [Clostridium sp. Marseille-QA1073]
MVNCYRPNTLKEALDILNKEECIILADGTDLMVRKKRWSGLIPNFEEQVLFISHLPELKEIKVEDNDLVIGSYCKLGELERNNMIPQYLKDVIKEMGSIGTRNIATIGGNICNSSPAADILPLLYALGSKVVIANSNGERKITIKELIVGPGKTILKNNEILKEIIIENYNFTDYYYHKVGTRKSTALAKVSFIGFYKIEDDIVKDIRIALGAVSPIIVNDRDLECSFISLSKLEAKAKLEEIIERYKE